MRILAPALAALSLSGCLTSSAADDDTPPPPATATQASVAETPPSVATPAAPATIVGTDAPASATTDEAPEPSAATQVPEGAEALAQRLRARHNADLPDADELAALADPGAALIWVYAHATTTFERARALSLMRYTPSDRVREHLVSTAGNADLASTVRAGAVDGLRAYAPSEHPDVAEVIRTCALDPDPIVQAAAGRIAVTATPSEPIRIEVPTSNAP